MENKPHYAFEIFDRLTVGILIFTGERVDFVNSFATQIFGIRARTLTKADLKVVDLRLPGEVKRALVDFSETKRSELREVKVKLGGASEERLLQFNCISIGESVAILSYDITVETTLVGKYKVEQLGRATLSSEMQKTVERLVLLGILFIYFVSSFEFLATKFALKAFSPFLLAGLSSGLAGLIGLGFNRIYPEQFSFNSLKVDLRKIPLAALFYRVLPVGIMNWVLVTLDSGVMAAINSLFPLWVVILTSFTGTIRFTRTLLAGVIVGLVGAALVLFDPTAFQKISFLTIGLAVLVPGFGAFGTLIAAEDRNLKFIYYEQMFAGIIMLLASLAFEGSSDSVESIFDIGSILGLLYLVVIIEAVEVPLIFWIAKNISMASLSGISFVIPIVAVLAGIAIGEKFSAIQALGLVGLLVGSKMMLKSGGKGLR